MQTASRTRGGKGDFLPSPQDTGVWMFKTAQVMLSCGKYWAQALFRVFLESPRRGTCPAWIQALQSTGIIRVNVLCTPGSLYKSKSCYRYHDYIPLATATRTLCIGQDVLLCPQGEVTNQVPEVLEDGGGGGVAKVEEREKAEQRLESGN